MANTVYSAQSVVKKQSQLSRIEFCVMCIAKKNGKQSQSGVVCDYAGTGFKMSNMA